MLDLLYEILGLGLEERREDVGLDLDLIELTGSEGLLLENARETVQAEDISSHPTIFGINTHRLASFSTKVSVPLASFSMTFR